MAFKTVLYAYERNQKLSKDKLTISNRVIYLKISISLFMMVGAAIWCKTSLLYVRSNVDVDTDIGTMLSYWDFIGGCDVDRCIM